MELNTAVTLLQKGVKQTNDPQQWADLGAGQGLFTKALASLLPSASTILAVDKEASSLNTLTWSAPHVTLVKRVADFSTDELDDYTWDGILLANALHFIKDNRKLLTRLRKKLKPGGALLIVEYDTDVANAWVPYPVSFSSLAKLAAEIGGELAFLSTVPSRYHREGIYSALWH